MSEQTPLPGIVSSLAADVAAVEKKGAIYSDDFRAWYAAFPRKRAPGDAWKAWRQLGDVRPPLRELLAALDWQKRSPDWQKDAGRWIPYPATYLRAHRWADEPPRADGRCPWHRNPKNRTWRNPNGAIATCPDCTPRQDPEADPAPVSDVAATIPDPVPPRRRQHDDSELRADFARLFPGERWPGYTAAFKAIADAARKGRGP